MNGSKPENWQDLPNKMRRVTSIRKEKVSLIWSISQFGDFLNRKYEFSSPVFLPNTPGSSKWKLVVFPEHVYPEGVQVALRLFKMSTDDKCYSVKYTISLLDINGKDHTLQTSEKVFRSYLDYDQCSVASNRAIVRKGLLQSDGTLTVCCNIDLLVCENPDDTVSDALKPCENINVPITNDLSAKVTCVKLTESENMNSSLTSNYPSFDNPCQKSAEKKKVMNNDSSEINKNLFDVSTIKMENTHYDKEISKHYEGLKIPSNESEKNTRGLSEKIDSFFHKTRQRAKNDSRTSKNPKDLEILSDDLNFLYTTKYQYDITIHIDDGQIRAHSAILSARSEYFRKTLTQSEKEIKILGIKSAPLDAVLYYLYTGQPPNMTYDLVMDILTTCDTFQLDHLRDMAENSLKSQINISNVIDIFRKSKEMKLENLKICALKFMAKNHEAVTKSAKWNQIMSDDPHAAGEILLTISSYQNKSNNFYWNNVE